MEIVKPHKKISREIGEKDIFKVMQDSLPMVAYCLNPPKNFRKILALAHPQVEDTDPLRFFVTAEKEIIVNPEITNHTRHTVDSLEGCVTFPENANITIQRYNKCVVRYYTFDETDKLIEKEENVSGQRAKMFQHEIDHLNGIYIYET